MPSRSNSVKTPLGISLIAITTTVAIVSFVIYYATAFRTITWWNSAEFSLAAGTLGIAPPPGCLLGTILGWIVIKLAVCGSAAFALNLFSGLIAAVAASLIGITAVAYLRGEGTVMALPSSSRRFTAAIWGTVIGGLTLAFAYTFWEYAIRFTPYMFTAFFTALILWAMMKWWQNAERETAFCWLFVVTLFFGLDFSVHRTNQLIAPGLIIWMLIRSPRTFLAWRTWTYGAAGLLLGLAFHLLMIPIASTKPFLNAGDPSNLSRFWDYVRLTQLGGGFLIKFFPRNAPFWEVQVMDYLRAFSANFFSWKGPIPVVGLLPGIFGIVGLVGLWRKKRRLAIGLLFLFALTSIGAIMYFNIPANFFRSLHRHYLPSLVIFTFWIAYGVGIFMMSLFSIRRAYRWFAYSIVALLVLAMPGYQIARNYNQLDGSDNYFAQDYALNLINNLPENSILITFGDNDTFPLWYYQFVEGIRPDVTVLNTSLLNTSWFVRQSLEREPDLPLGIELADADSLRIRAWQDTTVVIPVEGTANDFNLAAGTKLPDSMYLQVTPTISERYLMVSDQLILSMIRANRWRRPIYVASTGGVSWLAEYLHFEGLAQRLTPIKNPPLNRPFLAANLLEKYAYRGYADDAVFIDPATKSMAANLLISFVRLADAAYRASDQQQLDLVKSKLAELMPVDRLQPLSENVENMLKYMEAMKVESPG